MNQSQDHNRGFTLLLTIIVISVVLSVTMASLNLSIKQVRLSTDTRDSEVAFQAANAGLECIRFWSRQAADAFEQGDGVEIQCFGSGSSSPETVDRIEEGDDGSAFLYEYQLSWGDSGFGERCSQMRFVVMNADIEGDGLSISNAVMRDSLPGYPVLDEPTQCETGGRCTIFSSQGYSTSCPPSGIDGAFPLGTIQREILVEF